ncbi:Extra-large guanine nucleotide-binding protein 3 [Abeliophyllum distichum]|uniref:Extra-large guanine nucleotide-binding protein 3 n=1 Tax=Abeliophyllum distichum TaxID=126358 RepID=A0ABD1VQL2_9LAMI
MLATRDFFENVVRHASFRGKPFVLLLNKYDIFEEKINNVPLTVCEWFRDFNPLKSHTNSQSLAHQAYYYIAMKFKELYASSPAESYTFGRQEPSNEHRLIKHSNT